MARERSNTGEITALRIDQMRAKGTKSWITNDEGQQVGMLSRRRADHAEGYGGQPLR
jgi:hypothetical protein